MPRGIKKTITQEQVEAGEPNIAVTTNDERVMPADLPSPDPLAPNNQSIDIYDETERLVRTYSLEVHGVNYAKLAEMYLAGNPNCRKG